MARIASQAEADRYLRRMTPTTDAAHTTDWRRVVVWAGIPLMIGALNEYALLVTLPTVRADFGLSVSDARWMLLAFVIADAAVLVLAGRYGDRVGRRRTATIGLALVALGSLACALAPSFALLLAARVVEGVGAGVLFSGLLAIISDAVPKEYAGRAFGLWAAVGAVAVLVSPVIGGVLSEYASWRWVLVLNAAISLVALVAARRVLPPTPPQPSRPTGGTRLTASPNFVSGTAITAVVYACATLTFLPLVFFLTVVAGLSPTQTGLAFVAYAIWWLVLPAFTGRLVDRIGSRLPVVLGLALGVAGAAIMAGGASAGAVFPILLGLCLLGIGASFTMPAANAVAMAQVPPDLRGEASGVNMTVRMTGSVIGLLISGSLLAAASRDDVIAGARLSWGIAAAVGLVGLLVGLVALRGAGSASR